MSSLHEDDILMPNAQEPLLDEPPPNIADISQHQQMPTLQAFTDFVDILAPEWGIALGSFNSELQWSDGQNLDLVPVRQ